MAAAADQHRTAGPILKLALATIIGLPVLAGLAGAVLPAMGYFPPLGGKAISLDAVRAVLTEPGLARSINLTVFTGGVAVVISTLLALLLPAVLFGTSCFGWLRRYLAPVLSLPHVTVAVGMLFLLQPSGWLMRLISPVLTGLDRPPTLPSFPMITGWRWCWGWSQRKSRFWC